jgi:GrpB-like predicted nucleotidyltransferase (UPF0157 family)
LGGKSNLHFLGIEVDRIADIPRGMRAWDLGDSRWTVWEAREGQDVVTGQGDLCWQWLEQSASGGGRYTGEFTARLPVEGSDQGPTDAHAFWISANAYMQPQAHYANGDEVHLADYDPSWPLRFKEMARWLRDELGSDIVLRVEHYGSTAIPGMPAKPIVDILVEIPDFAAAKARAVPRLNSEVWEYWWYSGHMVFVKRENLMGQRTHHVHMAPWGHPLWEGLAFRDHLRSHPEDAARYAALKHELAASHGRDRERYTQAKTELVREITSRALCGS